MTVEPTEGGSFRLVLDSAAELDIEALEDGGLTDVLPGATGCLGTASGTGIKKKR